MTPGSNQITLANCRSELTTSSSAQVGMKDADMRSMIDQTSITYNDLPVSLSDYYSATALPLSVGIPSMDASGTAWNPGTADYTQCVVEVNTGSFRQYERYNGTQYTNDITWSPIGSSETMGDYEVKYEVLTGGSGNVAMGPGWAAENTYATLTTSGFYFSCTAVTYATPITVSVRVTFRSTGSRPTTTRSYTFAITVEHIPIG